MDIELPDVDKSGQNVDKSVYNSQECRYTEVLVRLYTGKNTSNSCSFQPYRSPSCRGYLIWRTTNRATVQLRAQKVVFTHMRTYEGVLRLPHNYL